MKPQTEIEKQLLAAGWTQTPDGWHYPRNPKRPLLPPYVNEVGQSEYPSATRFYTLEEAERVQRLREAAERVRRFAEAHRA